MKPPYFGSQNFNIRRASTRVDKLSNVEYQQNPTKRPGASDEHIHPDARTSVPMSRRVNVKTKLKSPLYLTN
jgi:hypothetical protein